MVNAKEILLEAGELVSDHRHRVHGDKNINFPNIATMWNAYLKIRKKNRLDLDSEDVALMLTLFKIARSQSGTNNIDDYIDGAGYIAIAGEMREKVFEEAAAPVSRTPEENNW